MNTHNKFTRKAGAITSACVALLIAGCCHDECDKDIVYAFDIPTRQADCPSDTTYIDTVTGEGFDDLGGSGIVDRTLKLVDHSGSGIVDRHGQPVKKFCFEPCIPPAVPTDSNVYPKWTSKHEFIIAAPKCAAAESSNE